MKLGIDARILTKELTGIGRYVLELTTRLSYSSEIELYLFAPIEILSKYKAKYSKRTIFVESSYGTKLKRQVWASFVLPREIKSFNLDVFWGPAHRLPKKCSTAKYVLTIHDLVWKYAPQTMRKTSYWLEKYQMPYSIRQADLILADSTATKESILQTFKVYDAKLKALKLGATRLQLEGLKLGYIKQPYILFVGTLEPRKNLKRLLEAYALLSLNLKRQFPLVIAGGKGWGNVQLCAEIKRLNLEDKIKLLDYVDEQKLHALYKNAHCLVMPSLYEGFGLPLVEAMQYGVPVLTSDNSSMPEVAGEAAILVDAGSVPSIAEGLNKLLTDRALHSKLSDHALKQAEQFNWDDATQKLIEYLHDLLGKK